MSTVSAQANEQARWSLRLFGDFHLCERASGDKVVLPGKRERVLLAYLALSSNGRQPRRKLVTLLWGEAADETTLDNLRTSVFNLRKALGDTERRIIAREETDIVLDASAFEVDVLEFRRLAAGHGATDLEDAAKLYTGEFLEGLGIESEEFESWRREESTRCKRQVLDALTKLMAQLAASGESERAIEAGLQILRLEPLHEAAVRGLMRLYAGTGGRATALELYRTLSDSLKKELGAQPEAETRAVYAELSRGENAPRATAAASAAMTPTPLSGPAKAGHPGDEGRPVATRPLRATAVRRSWVLAGSLVGAAALAMALFMTLGPSTNPASDPGAPTVVAATPTRAIAIAVLPFANLSDDRQQEFFSNGITEEIVTALARIPDLRVVARSSASQFKGEGRDMRAVGQALGATHLIEGSVRKDGTRVRITAHLINADDVVNVWANSYDRELTDVFAIQEDIATSIAGALRMPLGLAPGERLVSSRSIDPESYQQFLRAKPLRRALQFGVPEAIEILEPLVARYPDFSPAWALLASSYQYLGDQTYVFGQPRSRMDELWAKAETAARRAIQLDPNNADAYLALGGLERSRGKLLAADDLFSKALELDPNNPDTLRAYMIHLSNVGRRTEALAAAQQLRALEPYVPTFNFQVAEMLWENGQDAAAIEILTSVPDQPPARITLTMIYASQGRYKEALDILATMPSPRAPPGAARAVRAAESMLRTAPARAESPQSLPGDLGILSFAYLHVGAPQRVLERYEAMLQSGLVGGAGGDIGFLWHPSYAPVRKLERFKALVRNAGIVEYWRAKGWPEFCRPTAGDDFVCD